MSYSTFWLVVPGLSGTFQSNVIEFSVFVTNLTSFTTEGTPMTKKAEVCYFQLNILSLYAFTDISQLVSQRNLKCSDKGLDESNIRFTV